MALHSRLVGNDDSHWSLGITDEMKVEAFFKYLFFSLMTKNFTSPYPRLVDVFAYEYKCTFRWGKHNTRDLFKTRKDLKMTLTCCGGKGGRARAAGVDGGQGWHRGAGTAAGGWSRMNLSIHRRTGHGRALLLSTVCRKQEEGGQLQVRNQKAFKRRCCPADTAVDGNQKHIFVTHISPPIAESYLNCVTCVLFSQ